MSNINDLEHGLSNGDIIFVGNSEYIVQSINSTALIIDPPYLGTSSDKMLIYKWANGFEWIVTFESHLGDQMLLSAHPADNWVKSKNKCSALFKKRRAPVEWYISTVLWRANM